MLGTIVVGLLVSARATIVVLLARSRRSPVRSLPPLFVGPRPPIGVEPILPMVRPSPPMPPNVGNVAKMPQPLSPPTIGERIVMDNSLFAEGDDAPPRAGNAETVRFLRPGEESVRILPGRLEVLSGETKHREMRFVRPPGKPAELILGRDPGPSPQAIALESDTVSRRHARFIYSNCRWAVTNLSRTNPVVVNDERIVDSSIERPLEDGDRVELGEVVLRFRSL